MSARASSRPAASPQAVVEVVVTSAHVLVAQAVCAGLGCRGFEARCVDWEGGGLHAHQPAPGQVLLVLDELASRAAVEAVAAAVPPWQGRSLLLTSRRPGATWGAIFAAGIGDIASSDGSLDELQHILDQVASGEAHTDPRRRAAMQQLWADWLVEEQELQERVDRLSPREASVLARLAAGQRVRDIGGELGVSEGTVRSQVKSLRRKLGAESQLGAVAMARRITQRLPEGVAVSVPMPRAGR